MGLRGPDLQRGHAGGGASEARRLPAHSAQLPGSTWGPTPAGAGGALRKVLEQLCRRLRLPALPHSRHLVPAQSVRPVPWGPRAEGTKLRGRWAP